MAPAVPEITRSSDDHAGRESPRLVGSAHGRTLGAWLQDLAERAGMPRMGENRSTTATTALLVALSAFLLLLLPAPAGAQDDPYGSTTTTTTEPTGVEATCDLSTDVASTGSQVTATVAGVPVGETVRLLFGGTEVARSTAQSDGQSAVATLQIRFTVPDVDDGSYLVAAVGATFTAECSVGFTAGGAQVLGFTVERGAGSGSSGRGSLPRTGVAIALLLAVALALLIVGRSVVDSARQRSVRPAGPVVPGPHAGARRTRRGPE